jgi:hypothetical protein
MLITIPKNVYNYFMSRTNPTKKNAISSQFEANVITLIRSGSLNGNMLTERSS